MLARLIGTVIALLALALTLPALVPFALAAVPWMLGVLLLLVIARLAFPPSRRRYR